MKREELEALGLAKEQIDSVMNLHGKGINSVKAKMEGVQEQLTKAHETIAARDTQLETLKNSTGDIEQLKQRVEALQAENEETAGKYTEQINEMKLNTAIKLMIAGKVHDEDLTAGQFDKSKLILNEDGTVTGLQDQLQAIQENKKFLFKATEEPGAATGFKFGTEQPKNTGQEIDAALNAAFGLGED